MWCVLLTLGCVAAVRIRLLVNLVRNASLCVACVAASCEFLAVVSMFVHLAIYSHDGIGRQALFV